MGRGIALSVRHLCSDWGTRQNGKKGLTTGQDKVRTGEGVLQVGVAPAQLQQRLRNWKQAPSLC